MNELRHHFKGFLIPKTMGSFLESQSHFHGRLKVFWNLAGVGGGRSSRSFGWSIDAFPELLSSSNRSCCDWMEEEYAMVESSRISSVLWLGKMIGAWATRTGQHAHPMHQCMRVREALEKCAKMLEKSEKLFYRGPCKNIWVWDSQCLGFSTKKPHFAWKRNI